MKHALSESSYLDVQEYLRSRSTILVPVGAIEQHGSYLPLGTDAILAEAVAHDCARAMGVMVAPLLPFGWSPQHMGGAGTISLQSSTLSAVVEDIAASLERHGFRRIVLVNGHRVANVPPLAIGASRAAESTQSLVVVADLALLAHDEYTKSMATGGGPMGHGDNYETSHLLHCRPELVNLDLVDFQPRPSTHTHKNMSPFAASSRAAWWPSPPSPPAEHPDIADPEWVTQARGAELHAAIVRDLQALVAEVEATALPHEH